MGCEGTTLNVALSAVDAAISYGLFKCITLEEVRVADMHTTLHQKWRRNRQSPLVKYLQLIDWPAPC